MDAVDFFCVHLCSSVACFSPAFDHTRHLSLQPPIRLRAIGLMG
jgi:hypothetical protein